jgi:hypothetical protein
MMPSQAQEIALLRERGKETKFDGLNLKTNCVKAAQSGREWLIVDPLQLFLLIDKVEVLEKNLDAVRNEIMTIEMLSADVRRGELREKMDLLEQSGETVSIAEMRAMLGV